MDLDIRLRKLSAGVSSLTAARAHARSLIPGVVLHEEEAAQAAEFLATIEAMFLVAAVDGDISGAELQQLAASVQAAIDLHVAHDLKLEETLADLADKLSRDGWNARLEAVVQRLRSDEARLFAFRLAAGVAFVDDVVAFAEAAALDALAGKLGLTPDESQAVMTEVQEELFGFEPPPA